MKYKDYLKKTTAKFQSLTEEIVAEYNFDLGNEYESVLCKALRSILPEKYGICRGFVTTEDSVVAGDDIIIYDRYRFNSIRPLAEEDYSRKEYIPVEAVYAYIEAKYTLAINDEDGQSLTKAFQQVSAVKSLSRNDRALNSFDPYLNNEAFEVLRDKWPNKLNPIFGIIFSHQVRLGLGQPILTDSEEINVALVGKNIEVDHMADLVVAGNSNVLLPFIDNDADETKTYHSPFYIPNQSDLNTFKVDEIGFGLGIANLLYALDTIRLGTISWPNIIREGLNL